MKIFSSKITKLADNYTIKNEPISSIDLMERAAKICTKNILDIYSEINNVIIFAGPGNNGGDGLAIARLLEQEDIKVKVYILNFTDKFSDDFRVNLQRLEKHTKIDVFYINNEKEFPKIKNNSIVIDAIFGSGLTRNLSALPENIVKKINELNAEVVAIDIPSGLFGEENIKKNKVVVEAKHTISFQYPFLSFMFPENDKYIGEFHIVNIGIHKDFINKNDTPFYYIEKNNIELKKRLKFSHKGTYGHALIFAGSYGMSGASVLSVRAAHKSGAGLVSAAVPNCNRQILQISSPETILQIDNSENYILQLPELDKYNAIAIGPAIGFEDATTELLKNLIDKYSKAIVFDADAITILSENKEWLKKVSKNSIFTPHPKEFERLVGKWNSDFERLQMQINFAKKYKVIVLLKGANSSIASPEGKVYFNSTGNPGMATGGSGDVLTGVIVSLLAQKYTPIDAAILGAFIHGLAGDFAAKKMGQNALIASDIIKYLPKAFHKVSV